MKSIFAMSSGGSEATVSVGYNFHLYLLAIVQAFGAYLTMIFSLVGLACNSVRACFGKGGQYHGGKISIILISSKNRIV